MGRVVHKSGVYQIRNINNGNLYVGSSKNMLGRWRGHLCELRHNRHHSPRLQNAWNKYGEEAFSFEILTECDPIKEVLLEKEQHFLDVLRPCYNVVPKAGSRLGSRLTEAEKERKRGFCVAKMADGTFRRVTVVAYRREGLVTNNTNKLPVIDCSGSCVLAERDHPKVLSGEWKHVCSGMVMARDIETQSVRWVSRDEFEANDVLVGIQSGKIVGSENPNASRIHIFDAHGNLMFECHGDLKEVCNENGLPFNSLRCSQAAGGTPIYSHKRSRKDAERLGMTRFVGWYARKIS